MQGPSTHLWRVSPQLFRRYWGRQQRRGLERGVERRLAERRVLHVPGARAVAARVAGGCPKEAAQAPGAMDACVKAAPLFFPAKRCPSRVPVRLTGQWRRMPGSNKRLQ